MSRSVCAAAACIYAHEAHELLGRCRQGLVVPCRGPTMIMMMIMTMGSEHRIPAEVETYMANEYLSVLVVSALSQVSMKSGVRIL